VDEQTAIGLVNLGIAGIGLYFFITGRIRSGAVVDAENARRDAHEAEIRAERDEWKRLALGTERRLDSAVPVVAHAIGAPVPKLEPTPEP
jgi:hypothetical protein